MESLELSKRIDRLGVIFLHNQISYTDFNNDIEVIKLCLKYSFFCDKIYSKNSYADANQVLDKSFNTIRDFFQKKLEYYGYSSETEVRLIWDESKKIDEKLKEITITKKEIRNKIIFLTQCFIYRFTCYKISEDTMRVILNEAERYADLI